MNNKKRSPIWKLKKEDLEKITKNSQSLSTILKFFGLSSKGGNSKTLKKRLEEDKIDYSHIKLGVNSNKGKKILRTKIPFENILVKNSTYNRTHLKNRLLNSNILKNECDICELKGKWNNKTIVMILDHKNGIANDHRLKNLRMLCPNCNSQQPTFAGRRLKTIKNCINCGKQISRSNRTGLCRTCAQRKKYGNLNRPERETLLKEVKKLGYRAVGRKYEVSDNAIRKWLK